MKLIYLAGPYRGKTEWDVFLNIVTARIEAEGIMRKGWAVYTPHTQTMFSALSFDDIMERDLEILSRADALVLVGGWEKSEGSGMEYDRAVELGLKIYCSPEEVPNEK